MFRFLFFKFLYYCFTTIIICFSLKERIKSKKINQNEMAALAATDVEENATSDIEYAITDILACIIRPTLFIY